STSSHVTGSGPTTYHSTVTWLVANPTSAAADSGSGTAPGPATTRGAEGRSASIPTTVIGRPSCPSSSIVTVSPSAAPRRSAVAADRATSWAARGRTPSATGKTPDRSPSSGRLTTSVVLGTRRSGGEKPAIARTTRSSRSPSGRTAASARSCSLTPGPSTGLPSQLAP